MLSVFCEERPKLLNLFRSVLPFNTFVLSDTIAQRVVFGR